MFPHLSRYALLYRFSFVHVNKHDPLFSYLTRPSDQAIMTLQPFSTTMTPGSASAPLPANTVSLNTLILKHRQTNACINHVLLPTWYGPGLNTCSMQVTDLPCSLGIPTSICPTKTISVTPASTAASPTVAVQPHSESNSTSLSVGAIGGGLLGTLLLIAVGISTFFVMKEEEGSKRRRRWKKGQ